MNRAPRFQKLALLAHIASSVGWIGAVVTYLAIVIAALVSRDEQTVRAACLAMEFIGWYVIVPFSLAALLTGLFLSLGTSWGLFRHWWIVAKLALTIFAVVVLFQHMRDVSRIALLAKEATFSGAHLRGELVHSAGGLLVLLAAMTLSVFKPWGMTSYGRRRPTQADISPKPRGGVLPPVPVVASGKLRWARIIAFHAVGIFVILAAHLVVFHVTGMHGLHHHGSLGH